MSHNEQVNNAYLKDSHIDFQPYQQDLSNSNPTKNHESKIRRESQTSAPETLEPNRNLIVYTRRKKSQKKIKKLALNQQNQESDLSLDSNKHIHKL